MTAVKNMNGQVALNGTVPSYPQYLEAAAAAQRVAGVTDVQDRRPPTDERHHDGRARPSAWPSG